MSAVITGVSVATGAYVGNRAIGGWFGTLAGGLVGYLVLPPVIEGAIEMAWPWPELDADQAKQDAVTAAPGLHVGASVVQPSIGAAVTLLRPVVGLFTADAGGARLASAALVNAWAESRFDPKAAGDVDTGTGAPHAVGLWQLHDQYAGKGMSVAQRSDPIASTKRILEVAKAKGLTGGALTVQGIYEQSPLASFLGYEDTPIGAVLGADAAPSLAELVTRWTIEVENPADSAKRAAERVAALQTNTYVRGVLTGLGLPLQ